ncbi:hypothetical protein V6D40_06185 [Corynebacterium sp. Q4381]|uniref:hypothetical protein n=1 Tax=Corynebacterium sp. Marseille-Q4381 TaxID=3121597 RepID=UPI002FE6C21A
MNVNLIAVALSAHGLETIDSKFARAITRVENVFKSPDSWHYQNGRIRAYNANRISGTWSEDPVFADDDVAIAFSQPPIPNSATIEASNYWTLVKQIVDQDRFQELQPNYFGYAVSANGDVKVWADILGFGRCYYIQTDDFFAASNHIGALTEFIQGRISVNESAVAKFAGAGFFMNNDSPISGITRFSEAQVFSIDSAGAIHENRYDGFTGMFEPVDEETGYAETLEQLQLVSRNIARLVDRVPTVFLSGGRDSRMTAGVWLSAVQRANVVTMGALPRESEIASELMRIYLEERGGEDSSEIRHTVTLPNPAEITMPLEERLQRSFAMWDGDAAPGNMKRNVAIPSGRSVIQIGGVGGEIVHGYYYSRPGQIEKLREESDPMLAARRSFGVAQLTESAHRAIDEAFSFAGRKADDLGVVGLERLDFLYLTEKLRRWGNQALGSTSAVLLAAPAFVRLAFSVTPEDKVSKAVPKEIVRRAIPQWAEVETYKASGDDSKRLMRQGTCTYQTDPDGFWGVWEESHHWKKFLNADSLVKFEELVRNEEATPVHESWMNRAIWIDQIYRHVAQLNTERGVL